MIAKHEVLQALDVSGSAVDIDIKTAGSIADYVRFGAHSVKDRARNTRRSTICAVQANAPALHGKTTGRNKMCDIAVATLHIINGAADFVARSQRNFEFIVDIVFYLLQYIFVHLVSAGIDQFNTVVNEGIVRRSDHNAAIECAVEHLIRKTWCGNNVQHIRIGTRGDKAAYERRFKHVA